MKYGDKVRVVNQESEYCGLTGLMNGLYLDGTVSVVLDRSGWEVGFEPHDIEEIDYLTRLSVDGTTIWPPAD